MPVAIFSTPSPRLSPAGAAKLQAALDKHAGRIPGCFLLVGTGEEVLFDGRSGVFDRLEEGSSPRLVDDQSIFWFASTTKLLTGIAALQLIERGILSFDTPVSAYLPQVSTPFKIITAVGANGVPIFEECNEEILVSQLMNQTGGMGDEFGDKIRPWKAWTRVGAGFTNSCQKANLLSVPPTERPGKVFQYGNCSEWLGLVIQEATGLDLDDYFKQNIFEPLGMSSTTFYPFSPEERKHLIPLRWRNPDEKVAAGEPEWVELTDQQDILKLPRTRDGIEYPVGGGGIYTRPADYHKLLRHLLHHRLAGTPSPELKLSTETITSIFTPSLPKGSHEGWSPYFREKYGVQDPKQIDWSTALSILCIPDGEQMKGYGRTSGSASWSGAPGIEYWMDQVKNVAVVMGTNFLPMGHKITEQFKEEMEKVVYEVLQEA
ncbi:hypothetical protein JCM8547_005855 [Rhodosporidiobolus lusitaniae]